MKDHGVKTAAITYTNNDYGKGLSDSIKTNFEKLGGKVTIVASHEDGKADYSAEVASLASAVATFSSWQDILTKVARESFAHHWMPVRSTSLFCRMA